MKRRNLLQALGAAVVACFLPREAKAVVVPEKESQRERDGEEPPRPATHRSAYIGVDYTEFHPETYRGVFVRDDDGKGGTSTHVFCSGDFAVSARTHCNGSSRTPGRTEPRTWRNS